MIIICDNCGTRYKIEEYDIGEEGREVRCSKCDHVWLQSPFSVDDDALAVEIDREIVNTITHNKPKKPIKCCNWLRCSCVLLLILIGVSLFLIPRSEITSILRPIYSIFGIYDSSELEFESAKFEYVQGGVLITSTIVNNSNERKVLPNMKISLYDGKSNVLRAIVIVNKDKYINQGEKKELAQRINQLPVGTEYITLDVGNKLEVWFQ